MLFRSKKKTTDDEHGSGSDGYEGPNDEFIYNLALWPREQDGEAIGVVGREWHRCH